MMTNAFFEVTEIDHAGLLVDALFRRKFGCPPPTYGRHFVGLVRDDTGALRTIGYTHFNPLGAIFLGGGACTDERVLRTLAAGARDALRAEGGVYYRILQYAIGKLAPQSQALFGYCGDKRAEAVDLRAGFAKTEHPHLLVRFSAPMKDWQERALIAQANAVGPF